MFSFGKASLRNREGVDNRLIRISDLALEITTIDFGIPESGGIRTVEEQYELFIKGLSKADGYEKKSAHQFGTALDFYAYVDGAASWDKHYLAVIAAAHLQAAAHLGIRLGWGGLWHSFKDYPHIQLVM